VIYLIEHNMVRKSANNKSLEIFRKLDRSEPSLRQIDLNDFGSTGHIPNNDSFGLLLLLFLGMLLIRVIPHCKAVQVGNLDGVGGLEAFDVEVEAVGLELLGVVAAQLEGD
jgi:hypothetical protein